MYMKKFLLFISLIALFSCQPNGNTLIRILENGIDQVEYAKTKQEVSDITYDVKRKMMRVGNLPGGDRKLSAKDTRRVTETQERFYRAVERRVRELNN